jgi:hypothetical protein
MYQEQARRHGQDISTTTDDGTFAGGLRHITSVLPSLMNDIFQHAPDSQKVCFNISGISEEIHQKKFMSCLFAIPSSTCSLSPFFRSWDGKLNIKL